MPLLALSLRLPAPSCTAAPAGFRILRGHAPPASHRRFCRAARRRTRGRLGGRTAVYSTFACGRGGRPCGVTTSRSSEGGFDAEHMTSPCIFRCPSTRYLLYALQAGAADATRFLLRVAAAAKYLAARALCHLLCCARRPAAALRSGGCVWLSAAAAATLRLPRCAGISAADCGGDGMTWSQALARHSTPFAAPSAAAGVAAADGCHCCLRFLRRMPLFSAIAPPQRRHAAV